MKKLAFALFILLPFLSLQSSALMCVDLFATISKPVREPHFPSSVYAKFPAGVVPKLLDTVSMDALGKALNQMTMEVSAEIPLPEGLGPKSKKIEMDIDVEQLEMQEGSLVSRLSTTLKTPKPSFNLPVTAPKDFKTTENFNSILALHLGMINAAIKSSLGDLVISPLKFESQGMTFLMTKAPVLSALPENYNGHSRLQIRAEVTIPRQSILMSGVAFKNDIRAQASLEAEFIVNTDNSVSLKVLGVHKNDFSLDPETMRFAKSNIVGRSAAWALEAIAKTQIERFNRLSVTQPVIIPKLFRVPQQIMGLNVEMQRMHVDNDGYLKVQLNINPKEENESNVRVRFKNRE